MRLVTTNAFKQNSYICLMSILLLLSLPIKADSVIDDIQEIVTKGSVLSKVWPGFWPTTQPFAVYDKNGAVTLVAYGVPPKEFSLHDKSKSYIFNGNLQHFSRTGAFEIDHDFGTLSATAVRVGEDGLDKGTIITLFHEAFHGYQKIAFKNEGETYVSRDEITGELLALKTIENHLLKTALLTTDTKQQNSLLGLYTALRKRREAQETKALSSAQLVTERKEGIANYIGIALFAKLNSKDDQWIATEISQYLDPKKTWASTPDEYVRWNGYGVGAAITFLLLQNDIAVYQRLAESSSPFELLSERYQADLSDALFEEFLEQQDFERIERKMNKSINEYKNILAKYNKKTNFLLTIELAKSNQGAFSMESMQSIADGVNLILNPSDVRFIGPNIIGSFSKYWFISSSLGNGRVLLKIAMPSEPDIECSHDSKKCNIQYRKMDLQFSGEYKIERLENEIRLNIGYNELLSPEDSQSASKDVEDRL